MSLKAIVDKTKEYSFPIVLALGVFLLALYYWFKIFNHGFHLQHKDDFKEVFAIALTILGSGIFLAVLKWFQFMGFFRQEIQKIFGSSQFDAKLEKTFFDILYSDEFLNRRQDLDKIWTRVTRCFLKTEFPDEISNKVNQELSSVFLHNDGLSHYCRNYIINLHIELDENGYLAITEESEIRLIRPNTSKFTHDFSYYVDKMNEEDKSTDVSFNLLKINEHEFDLAKIEDLTQGNKIRKKAGLELEGATEYTIKCKATLKYNIDFDCEYELTTRRVVDSVFVYIKHSENLKVIFTSIGKDQFKDINSQGQNIAKTCSILLLPDKGFRLIFIKK